MVPIEHGIAIAGLVFLVLGGLSLVVSVVRGKRLCRRLASRSPKDYAELGSPLPGYFASSRRHAYFRVVLQRSYERLDDPDLVAAFARLRRLEVVQLVFLLAGFAGFGVAYVWLNWI